MSHNLPTTTQLYGSLVMKIHEARMIADQARRLTSTATTRKAAACWTERANALVEAALGLKDTVGIDLPDPDDIPPQRAGESLCDYEVRIGFRAPASAPVTSAPASAPLQAPAPTAELRLAIERFDDERWSEDDLRSALAGL